MMPYAKAVSAKSKEFDASGNEVHKQWVELGNFLVMKYNDGYVKDSVGRIKAKGYPEEWLNTVTKQEGVRYIINKRE
jgi:hypothetical protein